MKPSPPEHDPLHPGEFGSRIVPLPTASAGVAPAKPSPPATATRAAPHDPDGPYWIPKGLELDNWPVELRIEVGALIKPIYKELVLQAKPGLVRSTGITIVHLLWLEILDHLEVNRQISADTSPNGPLHELFPESRAKKIERHLRLVHTKLKASELLRRLQELKARWRANKKPRLDVRHPNLSAVPRRPRKTGKNDFR